MKKPTPINARVLTGGQLLARNTLWNIGASVASIAISLFSVPVLLRYLGADRFGVISLIWIVEGQFSLFDLGLSQALTKMVAEKLGMSKEQDVPPLFWSSLLIMFGLGLVGALILRESSWWLVYHVLNVPPKIQAETLISFHLVAISLPLVISSAALRGLLVAYQRFDLLSAVRIPISIISYLVPLCVLPFSRSLGPFILVLVISRVLAWFVHLLLCLHAAPVVRYTVAVKNAPLRHMFTFGGWMTVTNLVGPIMVNIDRLLIGSLVSMASVAYYATPYEAATRLWIIPSAVCGVLFPAFATALSHDRNLAALLFDRAVKYIFVAIFPIVVAILAFGPWALQHWLGVGFSQASIVPLQLLSLGVFANSLAQVPFWHIQAANRPDLPAKLHLIELPCYLLTFWLLTRTYGINGAALAWLLRTVLDGTAMFWLSGRVFSPACSSARWVLSTSAVSAPVFLIAVAISGSYFAVPFVIVVYTAFFLFVWFRLFTEREKRVARAPIAYLFARQGEQQGGESIA